MIQNNMLYTLRYQYEAEQKSHTEDSVNAILEIFGARCGVSQEFENLLEVAIYQRQAEDALEIGREIDKGKLLYNFDDYRTSAILLPRVKELARVSYVPKVLKDITDYDRENSTELFITLKCYVNNMLNTSITAKELHLHRNSLLYRIGRIEEVFQLSLKDPKTFRTLLIAFYMIELEEQLYHE